MGKKISLVKRSVLKTVCAAALGINRKNIYRTNILDQRDQKVKEQIKEVHKEHSAYGHKRIADELHLNKKRILRVMKKYGIKPPRRRSNFYTTKSTSHHTYYNLIKGWKPTKPHQIWVSDLSYIKHLGKMWYVATIIDIYTRQVLSVQVGKRHNSDLVMHAIQQAVSNSKDLPEIFHSDQGNEFMAKQCTHFLEQYEVKVSVSDKASPWQNGYQESFFSRFKAETGDLNRFETIGAFIEAIYSYVHYYNNKRIHTALRMPPNSYAQFVADNCLQKQGT